LTDYTQALYGAFHHQDKLAGGLDRYPVTNEELEDYEISPGYEEEYDDGLLKEIKKENKIHASSADYLPIENARPILTRELMLKVLRR